MVFFCRKNKLSNQHIRSASARDILSRLQQGLPSHAVVFRWSILPHQRRPSCSCYSNFNVSIKTENSLIPIHLCIKTANSFTSNANIIFYKKLMSINLTGPIIYSFIQIIVSTVGKKIAEHFSAKVIFWKLSSKKLFETNKPVTLIWFKTVQRFCW